MYVYTCAYICIHTYIRIFIHTHICINIHTCVGPIVFCNALSSIIEATLTGTPGYTTCIWVKQQLSLALCQPVNPWAECCCQRPGTCGSCCNNVRCLSHTLPAPAVGRLGAPMVLKGQPDVKSISWMLPLLYIPQRWRTADLPHQQQEEGGVWGICKYLMCMHFEHQRSANEGWILTMETWMRLQRCTRLRVRPPKCCRSTLGAKNGKLCPKWPQTCPKAVLQPSFASCALICTLWVRFCALTEIHVTSANHWNSRDQCQSLKFTWPERLCGCWNKTSVSVKFTWPVPITEIHVTSANHWNSRDQCQSLKFTWPVPIILRYDNKLTYGQQNCFTAWQSW